MAACKLTVLGGFALTSGDGTNIALPTRKDRLLLSYLGLNAGQALSREKLYGLLWADREEAQARGSLRQSLAALRDAFHSCGPRSTEIGSRLGDPGPDGHRDRRP